MEELFQKVKKITYNFVAGSAVGVILCTCDSIRRCNFYGFSTKLKIIVPIIVIICVFGKGDNIIEKVLRDGLESISKVPKHELKAKPVVYFRNVSYYDGTLKCYNNRPEPYTVYEYYPVVAEN